MSGPNKGVSDCYVFKSRLQEYAQKVGLPAPLYETAKEGPSHKPSFKSTVTVSDVRYDSLPGFSNRKAAEQSAAEIALMELVKSGEMKESISQPVSSSLEALAAYISWTLNWRFSSIYQGHPKSVLRQHETGLCKNLLQEYAQKMNYAIPTYACQKDISSRRGTLFSCSVEIGGIRYIGAAAMTKKEAEIKAARTALLAIQSSSDEVYPYRENKHTVVPCKREAPERTIENEGTARQKKTKRARIKRKLLGKRRSKNGSNQALVENAGVLNNEVGSQGTSEQSMIELPQIDATKLAPVYMESSRAAWEGTSDINQSGFTSQSADKERSSGMCVVQALDHGVLSLESMRSVQGLTSTMDQNGLVSDQGILSLRSSTMVDDLTLNPNRSLSSEGKGHSSPLVNDELETIPLSGSQKSGSNFAFEQPGISNLKKCSVSEASAGKEISGYPIDVHPINETCEWVSASDEFVVGQKEASVCMVSLDDTNDERNVGSTAV